MKTMTLELARTYLPKGTNGCITLNGRKVCNSIELPWLNNQHAVSCIPEGSYVLKKRYSPKFKWHLQLADVPGRDLILLHPANDAHTELRGCIAPVSLLTGEGRGTGSAKALKRITELVYPELLKGNPVYLKVTSIKTTDQTK